MILLLLLFIPICSASLTPPSTENVWLDPNDPTAKYRKPSQTNNCEEKINNDKYLRLILRQMMHDLHVDYTIPEYVARDVKIQIPKYSMSVLSKYLTADEETSEDTAMSREIVRSALADIFKVNDDYIENNFQDLIRKSQPILFTLNILILPAALIVIIKSIIRPKNFYILLISTIFIISMYCGYNRKYQEAEARRFAQIQQLNSLSDACAPEGLLQRFSDSMLSLIRYQPKSDCQKYIEHQFISIFFEISPIEVFSETVASGLLSFFSESAKHFKRFFRDLYEGTPIMAQIVMTVFLIATFGKIKTPFFSYEPILLKFLSSSVSKMVEYMEDAPTAAPTSQLIITHKSEPQSSLCAPAPDQLLLKSEPENLKESPKKSKKRGKKLKIKEEEEEVKITPKLEDSEDEEWENAINDSDLSSEISG